MNGTTYDPPIIKYSDESIPLNKVKQGWANTAMVGDVKNMKQNNTQRFANIWPNEQQTRQEVVLTKIAQSKTCHSNSPRS